MKQLTINIITIAIVALLVASVGIFVINRFFSFVSVDKEHYDNRMNFQDITLDSLIIVTKRLESNQDTLKRNQNISLQNQIILQNNLDTLKKGQAILHKEITGNNVKSYFIKLINEW